MKSMNCILPFALALGATAAGAAPDAPAQLAEATSRNMSMVSSALAAHQARVNDVATTRAAHIVSVDQLAIDFKQESDREVEILKQTGGTEIARVFAALCEHGDAAALAPAQREAALAAARADVASAYTPLSIATGKLDSAATTLATLGKPPTAEERAKFFLQYARDVRDESKKLAAASDATQAAADKKLDGSTQAATASVAAARSAAASSVGK